MVGRAAAHNVNLLPGLHFLGGKAGLGQIDFSVLQHGVQSILHSLGLLMDFLHHKVLKAGLFGGLGIPFDFHQILGDFVAVQVVEGNAVGGQPGDFHVADVVNTAGVFQNGGHIGGQVALSAGNANDHGAVLPGGIDLPGVILKEHRQGIGAPDADHGMVDGVHRGVGVLFVVVVNELDGHLRIGGGVEAVALPGQLFPQLLIVFDNAVVNGHHIAVIGAMGVGIVLAGFAVGGPAGVADAAGARQGQTVVGLLRQRFQPALGFHHLYRIGSVPNGQTGGVVAPIFQTGQPLQQDGGSRLMAGKTNNSTHSASSPHTYAAL